MVRGGKSFSRSDEDERLFCSYKDEAKMCGRNVLTMTQQ